MSKFTATETLDGWRIIGKHGFVADVYGDHAKEKATLFAAAPDMLAALKSVCNYLDGFKGPFNHELLNIRDVIAKAEGKEP